MITIFLTQTTNRFYFLNMKKTPIMGNSTISKPSKKVQIALGVTSSIIILAIIGIILASVLIKPNNPIPLAPTVTPPINPPTSVTLWSVP